MPSVNDAAKAALNVTGGVAKNVVALTDKGPLGGFKKFISRGSMIDMAVGVVMGSAVTTVVVASAPMNAVNTTDTAMKATMASMKPMSPLRSDLMGMASAVLGYKTDTVRARHRPRR